MKPKIARDQNVDEKLKKHILSECKCFLNQHCIPLLIRWVVYLSHEYFNFIMYDAKYYQHFIGGVHFSWEHKGKCL